jgi:hypothetical protein
MACFSLPTIISAGVPWITNWYAVHLFQFGIQLIEDRVIALEVKRYPKLLVLKELGNKLF